jgi:biotin carboxylase
MARKKTAAQLNREINQVLASPTTHSRKKTSGPSQKTKTIGGYKVTILDHKTLGGARFAAYYDLLPASVVGRGETEAEAIADLKRAADHYGTRRQAEIEREDWAQHEAEKEEALERGDY